jgi:hypothetical protein
MSTGQIFKHIRTHFHISLPHHILKYFYRSSSRKYTSQLHVQPVRHCIWFEKECNNISDREMDGCVRVCSHYFKTHTLISWIFIIVSWCSNITWAVNTIIFYFGFTRLPDLCQMTENGSFYEDTWAHTSRFLHQRTDTDAVSRTLCSCLNMKQ